MAEIPPDPDEFEGDLPRPAFAPLAAAWEQWRSGQYLGDPDPHPDDLDAREAFAAGWWAGGAYLAHRIAGELGIAVVSAAAPDGLAGAPEPGEGYPSFGGTWGPLRARGEAIDKG